MHMATIDFRKEKTESETEHVINYKEKINKVMDEEVVEQIKKSDEDSSESFVNSPISRIINSIVTTGLMLTVGFYLKDAIVNHLKELGDASSLELIECLNTTYPIVSVVLIVISLITIFISLNEMFEESTGDKTNEN